MAFYNVWSRPFIQRSSALGFLAVGMSSGAFALITIGLATNRIEVLATFGPPQWLAAIYLGVGGGALAFILWALALQRTTPTRVATTITVQPIAAASLAAYLLGEPAADDRLARVFLRLWIATTDNNKP
jgi:drug/metabolite transporter (DMT)-like permease